MQDLEVPLGQGLLLDGDQHSVVIELGILFGTILRKEVQAEPEGPTHLQRATIESLAGRGSIDSL